QLSEYHLEAAIAACHSTAREGASTDWARILSLYDQLVKLQPSPVALLNRAVAVARVHGPRAGLQALDTLPIRSALDGYLFFHAVRGTLLAEAGEFLEALRQLRRAEALAQIPGERAFLARRIAELTAA
ncbi:MAG: sigma factor, ECF subfamily protein, partial [Verrucomicrobiales bacterium]|nr:sigma factor, ECF subfamily protein [Verrucomicrobiales bacterium]